MSIRTWFRAGVIAVLSVALSTTIAVAQDHGNGHQKHDRDDDDDRGNGHGKGHAKGHGHETYSDHDGDIHDWYRAHYSNLPPGLAKRDRLPPGLERQLVVSGTLPPGLQKKMQPCPRELEIMLPPPPPNYAHFVIGGNLVLVNRANFQIADVFHFEIN
jgi:Ni/Co efflux regulator RcnB